MASGPRNLIQRYLTATLAMTAIGFVQLTHATPAHADLRLCNSTNSLIGVAVGYNDGRQWVSEGWWNVQPNSCDVVLDGALSARYYYVYAVDYERGGEWSGGNGMCTQDKEFVIEGSNARCEERGFHINQFMEIDTGDQDSWTVQLTEPMRTPQG